MTQSSTDRLSADAPALISSCSLQLCKPHTHSHTHTPAVYRRQRAAGNMNVLTGVNSSREVENKSRADFIEDKLMPVGS